jgi:ribonuclease HI
MSQNILVFTDGASKGNPGPGGWGVIIVTPDGHVTELGGGSAMTTNNKMELMGAIEAFMRLQGVPGRVDVYTDSTYVIQGIREWIHGWRRRGWKTAAGGDVLNRDLWEALSGLTTDRGPRAISWHYVRGHVGTPGNERVDEIADAFATRKPVTLYDGLLLGYGVPVHDLPEDTSLPERGTGAAGGGAAQKSAPGRGASKGPAYSYLSLVDGVPMRHATWPECERRVNGRAGARFRKAASAADQDAILRSWGVDPRSV